MDGFPHNDEIVVGLYFKILCTVVTGLGNKNISLHHQKLRPIYTTDKNTIIIVREV